MDSMEFRPPSETPAILQTESQNISETKLESPEVIETSRQIDQITFEPETVVERGDFQQAEAIEAAFMKTIEAPIILPEIIQSEPGSSDAIPQGQIIEEELMESLSQTEVIDEPLDDMQEEVVLPRDKNPEPEVAAVTLERVFTVEQSPEVEFSPEKVNVVLPKAEDLIPVIVSENGEKAAQPQPEESSDAPAGTADEELIEVANPDIDTERVMETDEVRAMQAVAAAREALAEARLYEMVHNKFLEEVTFLFQSGLGLKQLNDDLQRILNINGFNGSIVDLPESFDMLFGVLPANGGIFSFYSENCQAYIDSIDDPSLWPSQTAYDGFRAQWESNMGLVQTQKDATQRCHPLYIYNSTPPGYEERMDIADAARVDAMEALTAVMGEEEAQQVLNGALSQAEADASEKFNEIVG